MHFLDHGWKYVILKMEIIIVIVLLVFLKRELWLPPPWPSWSTDKYFLGHDQVLKIIDFLCPIVNCIVQ